MIGPSFAQVDLHDRSNTEPMKAAVHDLVLSAAEDDYDEKDNELS